ncbi:2-keto-4-pentenoate hydratase [Neomicrococcus aestuarii]|uniref:2-keto-4-pentenoate hydratase n=1 Tax=Neomicrococcus aestuarii TaxID=556325 RepID=A0A7W8TU87_9MICC|nr:fumarylacetoacetate hydrolase family protein [Neomicrococcus aestuarii]MBB5512996.1 2-keto-4-pentenoate hydratase [Neomicrococcus aestuarii]
MTLNNEVPAAGWADSTSDQAAAHQRVIVRFGEELLSAYETKEAIDPLRDQIPNMSLAEAYAIQEYQLHKQQSTGRVLAGRKVGLTSLAMQQQLGVDEPDFGYFFKDMVYGPDAEIATEQFISPKVEPEFGFVLKSELRGPNVTREEALEAIEAVYAAIEIIDSRIKNWDIKLVDTVADNASCGAIAVGSTPLDVTPAELADIQASLLINGEVKGSGTGEAVMGDPIAPLVWLANTLGNEGVALGAGQLILPGSFCGAAPVVAGESATADFGDLGSLTIKFV